MTNDLIGKVFGKLTVIKTLNVTVTNNTKKNKNAKRKALMVNCAGCNSTGKILDYYAVIYGKVTSCGCYQKSGLNRKGHIVINKQIPALYNEWVNMKRRCRTSDTGIGTRYKNVHVSILWEKDFDRFEKDILDNIGPCPSSIHSLDRINNEGHYELGNVRWATPTEQARNRSNNRILEIEGQKTLLIEEAEKRNIAPETLQRRIDRGMSVTEALNKPVREYAEDFTFNGKTQSYSNWYRETGVKQQTFSKRRKLGWTIEEALNLTPRIKNKH